MDRVRIGLIGAGVMGRVHADNFARLENADLVAVSDVFRAAAQAIASKQRDAVVYEDFQPLLDHPGLDAVVIATPPDTHGEIIEAAAMAGKHILCEKPIDVDLARADRALKAVSEAGVKLQIGFHRRFDPSFARAHAAVSEGAISRSLMVNVISRDPLGSKAGKVRPPGDLFFDTTIHDFDMARWMVGQEVSGVYAVGGMFGERKGDDYDDPDTALIMLRFEGGVVGTIDNSRLSSYGYDQRLEVFGTGGTVAVGNERPEEVSVRSGGSVTTAGPRGFFKERYERAFSTEIEAFLRCLLEDKPPPVTGEDGRAALVLALAAFRSYREGRPVSVSEIG